MGLKCQILLRPSESNIYTSGQVVPGTLRYSIDKPTTFKSITIFFTGKLKGKCKSREERAHLIEKEVFVSMHENVLQEKDVTLNTGEYEHAFIFLLPKDLPSTHRDKTCTISYKILAEFKRPELFKSRRSIELEIPVYGTVKTRLDDRTHFVLTKTPFLATKNMDVVIKIDKTFYTPGELIKLECHINNNTNLAVAGIIAKLIAKTTYKYDMKHKKVNRETLNKCVVELSGTSNGETELTCAVPTNITNLYSIQHSKFLSREYVIHVIVRLPFPHKNISIDVPVVIASETNKIKIDVNCHYSVLHSIPYLTLFLSKSK